MSSINHYSAVKRSIATHCIYATFFISSIISTAALAQRAAQSANRDAEDAFGTTLSNDEVGLYDVGDVRGFSPVDAGNIRIKGLALDQAALLNFHVLESSTVRVGPSGLAYPFRGATGVVDFNFPEVTGQAVSSGQLSMVAGSGSDWSANLRLPFRSGLGLFGGVGGMASQSFSGSRSLTSTFGIGARAQVIENLEVIPVLSVDRSALRGIEPMYFPSGSHLPPAILKRRRQGSRFISMMSQTVAGVTAQYRIFGAWDVRAGIMRAESKASPSFLHIISEIDSDGRGQASLIGEGPSAISSQTVDVRISKDIRGKGVSHKTTFSVMRRQDRRYYSERHEIDLGLRSIFSQASGELPAQFSYKPSGTEATWVGGIGIAYKATWDTGWELGGSAQWRHWRRRIDDFRPNVRSPSKYELAYDASAIGKISDTIAVYAGYVQGVEERESPPPNAVNRQSTSVAVRTRQYEIGMKWKADELMFVGGYFDIAKPYYDVNDSDVYGRRGTEQHRGIEASLSASIGSLSLVAGASLYDASVRELSGKRAKPGGVTGSRTFVSLDYSVRPETVFVEAEINYVGGAELEEPWLRTAGALEVTVGARLVSNRHGTLRIMVANAMNSRGWTTDRSSGLTPRTPRSFGVSYSRDVAVRER